MGFRSAYPALVLFFIPTLAFSASRICTVENVSMRCGDATESVQCDGYGDSAFIRDDQPLRGIKLQSASGEQFYVSLPRASVHDYLRALVDYRAGNFSSSHSSAREAQAIADIRRAIGQSKPQSLTIVTFSIDKAAPLYETCHSQEGKAKPSDRGTNALDPNPLVAKSGLTPSARDTHAASGTSKSSISVLLEPGSSSGSSSVQSTGY